MAKSKAKTALEFARHQAETSQSWTDLHNALFGIGGKCGELFPTDSTRVEFSRTKEFKEIVTILESLQQRRGEPQESFVDLLAQANGKILVRLPKSIHAALLVEAEAEGVSLNQLCLAKLAMQLRSVA